MRAKEDGTGSAPGRKRIRRGIEGWRTLISQQRTSGETMEAFCAARGIPRSSFSKWRSRLESEPTPATASAIRESPVASVRSADRECGCHSPPIPNLRRR